VIESRRGGEERETELKKGKGEKQLIRGTVEELSHDEPEESRGRSKKVYGSGIIKKRMGRGGKREK
jgi:hypothetical protein